MVPGPDFPTGGIHSRPSGHSRLLHLEAAAASKSAPRRRPKSWAKTVNPLSSPRLPFQVNKARLIEHVAASGSAKRSWKAFPTSRDESDRDGMRIVFELKRGEKPEVVLNNLYKQTQMQVSFGVIMLAIVNGQPRELGLIDVIKRFLDHRVDVVRRRTDYLLRKARDREHLLLGFQKALDLPRRNHHADSRSQCARRKRAKA